MRYVKFDDEINDQINQEVLPPFPVRRRRRRSKTDTLNIFDIENNLIGFQGGVKYDIWQLGPAILAARAS